MVGMFIISNFKKRVRGAKRCQVTFPGAQGWEAGELGFPGRKFGSRAHALGQWFCNFSIRITCGLVKHRLQALPEWAWIVALLTNSQVTWMPAHSSMPSGNSTVETSHYKTRKSETSCYWCKQSALRMSVVANNNIIYYYYNYYCHYNRHLLSVCTGHFCNHVTIITVTVGNLI